MGRRRWIGWLATALVAGALVLLPQGTASAYVIDDTSGYLRLYASGEALDIRPVQTNVIEISPGLPGGSSMPPTCTNYQSSTQCTVNDSRTIEVYGSSTARLWLDDAAIRVTSAAFRVDQAGFSWRDVTLTALSPGQDTVVVDAAPRRLQIATGEGNDVVQLYGAPRELTADLGAGDDEIVTGPFRGALRGGPGVDTVRLPSASVTVSLDDQMNDILGGRLADVGSDFEVLVGSDYDDVLSGTDRDDTIDAGAGNDTILGLGGHDVIFGGAGNDTITPGAGPDAVAGDAGDDRILARDDTQDAIDCGAGNDFAQLDRTDLEHVANPPATCEGIDVPPAPPGTPGAPGTPGPTDPPVIGPVGPGVVEVKPRVKVDRRARSGALRATCAGGQSCNGVVEVVAKVRVKGRKRPRSVVLGEGLYSFLAGASTTIRLDLTKRAVRMVKRTGRVKVVLRFTESPRRRARLV